MKNFAMITIENATAQQLEELVPIYKKAFKKHCIFKERTDKEIMSYLKEKHNKNTQMGGGFMVAMLDDPLKNIDDKIIGGILVEYKGMNSSRHMRVALKHLAVEPAYQDMGAATDLINASLDKLYFAVRSKKCSSVKAEVHVAENEKSLALFKKIGFKAEGKLSDYYRLGEDCFILGMLVD